MAKHQRKVERTDFAQFAQERKLQFCSRLTPITLGFGDIDRFPIIGNNGALVSLELTPFQ